jgi:hypothetical protein
MMKAMKRERTNSEPSLLRPDRACLNIRTKRKKPTTLIVGSSKFTDLALAAGSKPNRQEVGP